jgi:DNA-directed RNA polymerase specialized sigma24 family protein
MKSLLAKVYKKHSIWIEIVQSFGCNKDTSEDIVMEMYIKLKKNLDRGLVIDYTDDDYNYFYIFKILKSLFIDLKRKEKITIIPLDNQIIKSSNIDVYYQENYKKILDELDKMYWYDKKVFELIDNGTSVAQLSRKTKIPYHSLYNTYRKVLQRLKKIL